MPENKHFVSMLENAACPKSSCRGFLVPAHGWYRCNVCQLEIFSVIEWRQLCIVNSFPPEKPIRKKEATCH